MGRVTVVGPLILFAAEAVSSSHVCLFDFETRFHDLLARISYSGKMKGGGDRKVE